MNERLANIASAAPSCQGIGNDGFGGEERGERASHVDGLRSDAEMFTKVFKIRCRTSFFGEWKAVSGVEQVSWKSEGWTSIGNVRVCIPGAK